MREAESPDQAALQAVPDHYGSLSTYVAVRNAAAFIAFLRAVFDAEERARVLNADGSIGHAEVWIGNRVLLMFDARPEWPALPALLNVYVADCVTTHARALEAGAAELTPLSTNAWGDRGSRVVDPFGNIWWLQTHVEDVAPAEMMRRMEEPVHLDNMRIAQQTLDAELRRRATGAATR